MDFFAEVLLYTYIVALDSFCLLTSMELIFIPNFSLLPPPTELEGGYVFNHVCLSVYSRIIQ